MEQEVIFNGQILTLTRFWATGEPCLWITDPEQIGMPKMEFVGGQIYSSRKGIGPISFLRKGTIFQCRGYRIRITFRRDDIRSAVLDKIQICFYDPFTLLQGICIL